MFTAMATARKADATVEIGTGWLPPVPDMRDYTAAEKSIAEVAKKLKLTAGAKPQPKLPAAVDLRKWCSPVDDQLALGSCTAHAGVGVIEYLENRAYGRHIDGSRLFVYKTTRNLMGVTGDTGAWLRTTMGALAHCGVPPETYWPYTDQDEATANDERTFDDEPTAFVYSLADNFEALKYFCHDPAWLGTTGAEVLASVKKFLAVGIPSMFGFWGFPTSWATEIPGAFPFPCPGESAEWGHAVVAIGYDDGITIENTWCKKKTKGALLIRNSWGSDWGDGGYGWIPYEYVRAKLASDFWSLLSMEWIDTKQFGL